MARKSLLLLLDAHTSFTADNYQNDTRIKRKEENKIVKRMSNKGLLEKQQKSVNNRGRLEDKVTMWMDMFVLR